MFMKLNTKEWKEFKLSNFFSISAGNYHYASEYELGITPYYSATNENNGIAQYINLPAEFKRNCIITGKVGCTAFYVPHDFCATSDVNIFTPNFSMSKYVGLFIVTVLNFSENYKWAYGRQCRVGNSNNIVIKLPICHQTDGSPLIDLKHKYSQEGYIPNFEFMENYIKSLHYKQLTTAVKKNVAPKLNVSEWKEFFIKDLIDNIYKSKVLNKEELENSSAITKNKSSLSIRYITRTNNDNGCELLVNREKIDKFKIELGNAITIGDTTATCFYQKTDFVTGDHIVVIRASWLNVYSGTFLCTLLNLEKYKYTYGRAFVIDSILNTKICLPILHNKDGSPLIDLDHKYSEEGYIPDFKFMENYIKNLPYSDRIGINSAK